MSANLYLLPVPTPPTADEALIARIRAAAARIEADLTGPTRDRLAEEMRTPLAFLSARGLPVQMLSRDEQGLFAEMVASAVLSHREQARLAVNGLHPSPREPACIGCTIGVGFLFVLSRFDVEEAAEACACYFQAPEGLMRAVLQIGVPFGEETAFTLAAALCRAGECC